MNTSSIHDVVAATTFRRSSDPPEFVFLTLNIGRPQPDQDGVDWECCHRITGSSVDDGVFSAYGVDSLQALCLALAMARTRLVAIEQRLGIKLLGWDGEGIGLPQMNSSEPPSSPS